MVAYYILHNFQNRNLLTLPENSILCNIQIKACFNQHRIPKKLIQIIMYLIVSDLGWIIVFSVI